MRKALIGVSLISLILAFFHCEKQDNLQLTAEQEEWKTYNRNVDSDDPDYPLEIIEDGFKIIRIYKTPAIKKNGIEIPEIKHVEWGWKYVVKNKHPFTRKKVSVTYILKDADGFEITSDDGYVYINPGETETIQKTATLNYDNLERVSYSGWTVTHSSQ